MVSDVPELLIKPFESLFEKTYRINIVNNRQFPHPPKWQRVEGWVEPDNWFERINDVVRTCFMVKYFDGVHFLGDGLKTDAERLGLRPELAMEAREEGYYAAHLYVHYEADIITRNGITRKAACQIELQITTQLQDVIRKMIHSHYERRRVRQRVPAANWMWDRTSPEFATNYLGHILHYLEGIIVEIRDKQREKQS